MPAPAFCAGASRYYPGGPKINVSDCRTGGARPGYSGSFRPRPGFIRTLVLAAVLLFAGCGNNPYPADLTSSRVLFRYLAGELRTLDPTRSYTQDEALIIDGIYQSYFHYHPLKLNPYELRLALGAEEPKREQIPVQVQQEGGTVTVQGERWTFKLRPDLRFQDDPCFPGGKGRQVVAKDVIYSFKRMADPRVQCPVLGFFADKIIGLDRYLAEARARQSRNQPHDFKADVPGLRLDAADPLRFSIVLNQPYPQLRYLMAMHFTAPIPHEAVDTYGSEFARRPVGCGQYVMKEYTPKRRIVLAVNPNRPALYYPDSGEPGDAEAGRLRDAGKQLPLNDGVVFNFITERITRWNFFLQGYLDRYAVTQDNFRQVIAPTGDLTAEMKEKGVRLFKSATPNIFYFAFNMTDPVVGGYTEKKRKLRQAISLAIDSQEFIDVLFDGKGTPADWVVPPGIYGYEPEYKNPYKANNIQLGNKLLAEAGYPKGIDPATDERFTLYYDNTATTPEERQFVRLLERQVERLGIQLESRVFRDSTWQDRVDKGQFQFVAYGWLADYPDPENFVFLLYGPNKRPGPNHAEYKNAEYDRIFEQMRAMEDGPERLELIRKLRAIAVEDAPWIPLRHDEALGLTYDWVSNDKPHGVSNDTMMCWSVDGEMRARKQKEWNRPNFWPLIALLALLGFAAYPAYTAVRARQERRLRQSRTE